MKGFQGHNVFSTQVNCLFSKKKKEEERQRHQADKHIEMIVSRHRISMPTLSKQQCSFLSWRILMWTTNLIFMNFQDMGRN